MIHKTILTFILLFFFSLASWSQSKDSTRVNVYAEEELYEDDPYFWSYSKEIGLNMTSLLSKFVPFNLGDNAAGLVDFRWKKYYGTRAFRLNLGAKISDFESETDQFIHLSIGLEKRYPLAKSKKVSYSSSWDIFGQVNNGNDDGLLGLSKGYGIEYHFTRRIYISTEANLRIGTGGDDGLNIIFDRPAAIFLHVRLY
jgi:hypothetical protein